jgi:hypothetical protein
MTNRNRRIILILLCFILLLLGGVLFLKQSKPATQPSLNTENQPRLPEPTSIPAEGTSKPPSDPTVPIVSETVSTTPSANGEEGDYFQEKQQKTGAPGGSEFSRPVPADDIPEGEAGTHP